MQLLMQLCLLLFGRGRLLHRWKRKDQCDDLVFESLLEEEEI